jgi:hypothetical protein
MTKVFDLDFHGTRFIVLKRSLFNSVEHQRNMFDAARCNVQSSVSAGIFKIFVNALATGTKVPVTKENSGSISLLAKEFWLEDLLAECSALQVDSAAELIAALPERITELEHQISSQAPTVVPDLKESVTNHDRQLENLLSAIDAKPAILRTEIDHMRQFAELLETELEGMKSKCEKQNETLVAQITSLERKMSDSLSPMTSHLSVCEQNLEQMKSRCEKQNETLVAQITSVERKMSDSLSPITSHLPVCERSLEQLKAKCASETLATRIGDIERTVSLLDGEFERKITESLSPVTGRLSICETSLERLKSTAPAPVQLLQTEVNPAKPQLSRVRPSAFLIAVEFPLKAANSLDGIISYLTRKHGGNFQDKRIVTVTSKSVVNDPKYALRNVVDLTSNWPFFSKNELGQWVCPDFHKLRVRPTHYTIKSRSLKSWVVESSLDGEAWTEIDRKTDNTDFRAGEWNGTASFRIAESAECRFIRLTQTGKRHNYLVSGMASAGHGEDILAIYSLEVFGTMGRIAGSFISASSSGSTAPIGTPTPENEIEFPLHRSWFDSTPVNPLEGIISYLTRKYGGNVHDRGIVTISSKSIDDDGPKTFSFLADLTSIEQFGSKNEPGQWICWDFHEMRVRPTHYTV